MRARGKDAAVSWASTHAPLDKGLPPFRIGWHAGRSLIHRTARYSACLERLAPRGLGLFGQSTVVADRLTEPEPTYHDRARVERARAGLGRARLMTERPSVLSWRSRVLFGAKCPRPERAVSLRPLDGDRLEPNYLQRFDQPGDIAAGAVAGQRQAEPVVDARQDV